jgi:hypothetical protein
MLAAWAASLVSRREGMPGRGRLRFVFYGRVSTEDWQDPVTSRARQLQQAAMLVAGHGTIVAEFFDYGQSRTLAWPRRPQAAALVAALADPDRGWEAVVIGEYERAFYGRRCWALSARACPTPRSPSGYSSPARQPSTMWPASSPSSACGDALKPPGSPPASVTENWAPEIGEVTDAPAAFPRHCLLMSELHRTSDRPG